MRDKILHLVILTLGLAFLPMRNTAAYGQEFVPDPAIQAQVRKIAKTTNDTGYVYIDELKGMANGNKDELARQAIWFSAKSHDERDVWLGGILMGQLGITNKEDILNAIRPFLWTTDADLKDQLHDMLFWVEGEPARSNPDFSRFAPILQANKTNPPEALVQYIFSRSPSKALKVLCDIYIDDATERQQILDADRAIREYLQFAHDVPLKERTAGKLRDTEAGHLAQSALKFLSQRSEWPVRRYVEAMNGNPELRF
jgi:hypothetical protein